MNIMSKLPDSIAITWHIDDVKEVDSSLTDEQCRKVLQIVKDNHDATIGVNWDTIEAAIQILKDDEAERNIDTVGLSI